MFIRHIILNRQDREENLFAAAAFLMATAFGAFALMGFYAGALTGNHELSLAAGLSLLTMGLVYSAYERVHRARTTARILARVR